MAKIPGQEEIRALSSSNGDVQRIVRTPARNSAFIQQLSCQFGCLVRYSQARNLGYPTQTAFGRIVVPTANLFFNQCRNTKIKPVSVVAPPIV